MSVYVNLMGGDNDDNLKWPFKGTIKVSLLNQLEDGQHHTRQLWWPDSNVPEECSGRVTEHGQHHTKEPWSPYDCMPEDKRRRVTEGERAVGWGMAKFIPQEYLIYMNTKEPWPPDVREDKSGRVTEGERAQAGWGIPQFIPLQDLRYSGDKNRQYLKDDTIFFRVECFEPKLD